MSLARTASEGGQARIGANRSWRLGYRPGLDGVRGLAISMVLFSHLVVDGLVGGLAGVTLFFVLSGF